MEGKITISVTQTVKGNYVALRIESNEAKTKLLDLKLSFENYGKLISGLGYQDCEIQTEIIREGEKE